MSQRTNSKDSTLDIDWLERSIIDEHINYYEYSNFRNIQQIGSGSYGNVKRANWKNTDHFFALKSFSIDKQTLDEIIKELKLHRSVDVHENIIRLCGITKEETDGIQKYSLVIEYADSGTLNNYLDNHFDELDWNDKSHLASQLANAVEFLHDNDIIHRDLHGNNVLIHQKNVKLADFGLSKKSIETSNNTSKLFGVLPYVDPKSFDNENYKLNKKSDVYSIGILLWQISSGYRPFRKSDYGLGLMLYILSGKREEIIDGTPIEYSNLYTECWKYEPNERPSMQEVVLALKTTFSPKIIIRNFNEDKRYSLLSEKHQQNPELNKVMTMSINNDNNCLTLSNLNTTLNLNTTSIINAMLSIESLNINVCENQLTNYQDWKSNRTSSQNYIDNLSIASDQTSSSNGLIESVYGAVTDKLINYIIKKHDGGINFDQVQQLIDKKILQLNQNSNKLLDWLSKNQDESRYVWFLGLFYYYNIGIEENSYIKTFELFLNSANNNCSIAQVYLAKCYYDGYGTNCDKKLTFYWYKKSVDNGSIIGKFYLGYCYEFGIGIMNNENESAYWYNEASKSGNTIAKLYLANCYKLGKGVDKDEIKAFKYYKILANHEISDAQLELGNCFYYGIGTKVDKIQAKYWYKKAANKENIIAKNIVKKYYSKNTRIEKENIKRRKFYKLLFFNNLNQFGLYFIGKILLKTNYEKAFYYLQKAARNGCKFAQFNLGKCYQSGEGVKKDTRKAFELYKNSAKREYMNAQFQLIHCYNFGFGTEINKLKAFELIKSLAKKGNKDALYLLGMHYAFGVGVTVDDKKAFEIFEELAKNENQIINYISGDKGITVNKINDWYSRVLSESKYMNAKIILGFCYRYGCGTEVNNKKAFEIFEKVAQNGNAIAQYYLGELYIEDNNEVKAFECYKESADKGFSESQFQIGMCYFKGIGTEIDKTKAIENIKESAEKRESGCAQNYLGELYELGRDVNKDLKQAVYWYRKAAENGCTVAEYNLGKCYENGNGVEKDERKAFEYYRKSADHEYSHAVLQVGYCYSKGIGTEVNKTKAFESYKKAADQGNKVAQYNLGVCYQDGKGVEKDKVKAFEYYKKSADQGHLHAQSQLGNCYLNGFGTEVDKKKAFELFKSTEKENNLALCNSGECYTVETDMKKVEAFEYYEPAENGLKDANFQLGYCCINGIGTEIINKEKGFEMYNEVTNSNLQRNSFKEILNDLDSQLLLASS
ncbi:hypothetical protein RclHR1_00020004 [Rhizophagus clarus]|uniref:Kinase-like domain-containing protein n=1 Tax=Rhizophagus clarus TaxID=94130 RepID=A0A2Z6R5R1_9GLOM|nr:hypothetical protein RclHR1_00020004 [Rhizophagus clarus]GES80134.1 kinase-like domain-containing protein [Rhizophagus clarus]